MKQLSGNFKRGSGLIYLLAVLIVFSVALARFFGFSPFSTGDRADPHTGGVDQHGTSDGHTSGRADLAQDLPSVVVFHTHTTENYNGKEPHSEEGPGDIVDVGKALVGTLGDRGIRAAHIMTVHDLPDWGGAVSRAAKSLEESMARMDHIGIFIDVHRDSIPPGPEPGYAHVEAHGTTYARILFIVGTADNPLSQHNLRFSERVRDKMEDVVPGISRGVRLMQYNNNGHMAENFLIVFIGDHDENTVEEAEASAKLLGQVVADMMVELNEASPAE